MAVTVILLTHRRVLADYLVIEGMTHQQPGRYNIPKMMTPSEASLFLPGPCVFAPMDSTSLRNFKTAI